LDWAKDFSQYSMRKYSVRDQFSHHEDRQHITPKRCNKQSTLHFVNNLNNSRLRYLKPQLVCQNTITLAGGGGGKLNGRGCVPMDLGSYLVAVISSMLLKEERHHDS
jgi:hypothetical protein